MTREEFAHLIEASVEQKLLEILGDPDEASKIRKSVIDRLLRQRQIVEAGERGQPLEKVAQQLGLG